MTIGTPKLIQYQGKIYRIMIYLDSFQCTTSGFGSGDVAYLTINILKDGSIIHSIQIDYDDSKESEIISDELVNLSVQPSEIITTTVVETFESGFDFSWDKIGVKLFMSKIHH